MSPSDGSDPMSGRADWGRLHRWSGRAAWGSVTDRVTRLRARPGPLGRAQWAALAVAIAMVTIAAARLLLGFNLEAVEGPDLQPDIGAVTEAVLGGGSQSAASVERELDRLGPGRTYIVIDRSNNRLWVRRAGEVLHEAVVSTGSGTVLKESSGEQRTWTFDTPRGRFRVLNERPNPVWTKPDWAFLEEGRQPPRGVKERREAGSLGEWALDLGDGYMIHGTLYERLLGRSITHGCIRVGRDDLRVVARLASPGTPVFIY